MRKKKKSFLIFQEVLAIRMIQRKKRPNKMMNNS